MAERALRVLITNVVLNGRTGTEMFARDLAHGLMRAGHAAAVYSPRAGAIADELRLEGIEVVNDLDRLSAPPDVIHGHHALPAMEAIVRFPGVPAIYLVHDRLHPHDEPPLHPRIRRYAAVDDNCLERLPAGHATVIRNAVDLERFLPRGPLPERPRRALLFSNYATEETVAAAVRRACSRRGIALDVAGLQFDATCERPEAVLGGYDVVFGKARCALEALAVGCAVVVCDVRGVGGLVTPAEFDRLRRLNFGMRTLVEPVTVDVIDRELGRYDAGTCADVSRRARAEAGLEAQVAQFVALYRDVLALPPPTEPEHEHVARFLRFLRDTVQASEERYRALADSGTMRLRRKLLRMPVVGRIGRWLARQEAPHTPMPVVVGVPRSGTTLLRLMLDSHPDLAVPPETGFLPDIRPRDSREALLLKIAGGPAWPDFHLARDAFADALRAVAPWKAADGVRAFYRLYAARFGKARWGEKTPNDALHMGAIERLLPEARFVHVVRDGRDVAASVRHLWFRPGDSMEAIAKDWCDRIRAARAQRVRHAIEIRYEELVREPEAVLQRVCAFVDLPFDRAMLEYPRRATARLSEHEARPQVTKEQRLRQQEAATLPPDPGRIGRWKTALTSDEVARFESTAGPLLAELGYPTSSART